MGALAQALTAPQGPLMSYAEKLLVGVTPAQFARMPAGKNGVINTNHPAFLYGHMAIYPAWVCGLAGIEDSGITNPDGFDKLFSHEAICRDDPDGAIYPEMEAITSHFFSAHKAMFALIAELSDQQLTASHGQTGEFFDSFSNRAALVAFMVGPHPFTHIGQMSAWRRCMGLGSAF